MAARAEHQEAVRLDQRRRQPRHPLVGAQPASSAALFGAKAGGSQTTSPNRAPLAAQRRHRLEGVAPAAASSRSATPPAAAPRAASSSAGADPSTASAAVAPAASAASAKPPTWVKTSSTLRPRASRAAKAWFGRWS